MDTRVPSTHTFNIDGYPLTLPVSKLRKTNTAVPYFNAVDVSFEDQNALAWAIVRCIKRSGLQPNAVMAVMSLDYPVAKLVAQAFGLPRVHAVKKGQVKLLENPEDMIIVQHRSITSGGSQLYLSRDWGNSLSGNTTVVAVLDVIASGDTAKGLFGLCELAGVNLAHVFSCFVEGRRELWEEKLTDYLDQITYLAEMPVFQLA